ncbi:hypothetical protein, partial [Spirosoma utsteinense]|uniref:hypothetical protein n=1 Tax=Spirosoma utsteinense TaxID=2585773 RepID=UPI001647E309
RVHAIFFGWLAAFSQHSDHVATNQTNTPNIIPQHLLKRSPGSQRILPFRKYYAANQDTKISDLFFFYFSAVRGIFFKENDKSYWDFDPERTKPTNILQTTVGYQALLKLMVDVLEKTDELSRYKSVTYEEYLKQVINIDFEDLQRYAFTSRSANVLYYDMSLSIWPAKDDKDIRIRKLKELLEKS